MKRILFLICLLCGGNAFSQCLTQPDSVFNNTVTLITATTARVNGDASNGDVAGSTITLKYVRVGFTDTVISTTLWPNSVRNLTSLQPGTQYVYYYSMNCSGGSAIQVGRYYFTTLSAAVVYATERSTVFPYLKSDTGLLVPRQDTSLFRGTASTGGNIVFKTSDSTFYGYRGNRWVPLMTSTAGLSNKVDSVTVYGDSLYYWINGVSYGWILPANDNDWEIDGNSGTTAGTNFIGTTDSVDFLVKTKSIEQLRFKANGDWALPKTTTINGGGFGWTHNSAGAYTINGTSISLNDNAAGNITIIGGDVFAGEDFTTQDHFMVNENVMTYEDGLTEPGYRRFLELSSTDQFFKINVGVPSGARLLIDGLSRVYGIGETEGTDNGNVFFVKDGDGVAYYDNTVHDGKFGINKSAPLAALDVTGGANITDSLAAGGTVRFLGLSAGVGTKAVRINPATGLLTYTDTTTSSGSSTVIPSIQNFRLTTESGVPVSITDRTAQSTIYLTPYIGNHISLYSGAAWVDHTTAEISLALSGLTSGKNYDVFAYNNAGTITLELSAAWTNDNTRADAVTRQDGILVKSGATTRRLIGTIRTTSTTTTEDSEGGTTSQVGGKRFVWNLYNQVRRTAKVIDQTDSWNYNTATWRQENGNAGNQIEYVTGDASLLLEAAYNAMVLVNNSTAHTGIGISSTTVPSGFPVSTYNSGTIFISQTVRYVGSPGLGYFYIAPLEKGQAAGTTNWYGDNGTTDSQSGLSIIITN